MLQITKRKAEMQINFIIIIIRVSKYWIEVIGSFAAIPYYDRHETPVGALGISTVQYLGWNCQVYFLLYCDSYIYRP